MHEIIFYNSLTRKKELFKPIFLAIWLEEYWKILATK